MLHHPSQLVTVLVRLITMMVTVSVTEAGGSVAVTAPWPRAGTVTGALSKVHGRLRPNDTS